MMVSSSTGHFTSVHSSSTTRFRSQGSKTSLETQLVFKMAISFGRTSESSELTLRPVSRDSHSSPSLRCSQVDAEGWTAHFSSAWEQRKLGDEFSFLRNNTLSRAELSISRGTTFDVHYGDVLVAFGSVVNPRVDKLPRIASDDVALSLSCDRLRDGDVIIADTAEDYTAGKCSELRGVGELTVFSGLHTIPLRPLQGYAPGFLGYCLNAPAYRKQLVPLMQGVKVISISRVALTGTVLTAPSLPEQRAIGAFFSSVDELITLHQRKHK